MFSKLQNSVLELYVNAETLVSDERGQDLVEYAILCALVAVVAIAATSSLGSVLSGAFSVMGSKVNSAIIAA